MLRLIVFTVLAAVMLAATTSAQPTAPISVPKPHGRVFDKLSPGDQK
ncbi:MAG: hypothetical protein HY725_00030, partial [Candidatus Rokubacteria bacterium]|nr:hypothetical protein [Candidatus Rokubacteria bacterium]